MPIWALALTLGLQALNQLAPMIMAAIAAAEAAQQPTAQHQAALTATQQAIATLSTALAQPK
jgi:hypothetical protein